MKPGRTFRALSDSAQSLFWGSLVVLALLLVGSSWAASASADPVSSFPLQSLPTRPSPSKPKPKPPSQPSEPATPIHEPPTPTPTAPSSTPTPTPNVDLTFEELGYDTFRLSESESRWIHLYLPRNLIPDNDASYLALTIRRTVPEPDEQAIIRVMLNNTPLAVIALSQGDAEPSTYQFYLKNTPLAPGRNRLFIAVDAGEGGKVGGARVDTTVYGSSLFHLEYSLTQYAPDLALYPIPFFERSFEREPVYVILPDKPSVSDLSAAATIAAGLGKASIGEIRLLSALDTQISADIRNNHHLIVIGKSGANRFLDQVNLPLRLDDPAVSEQQGVMQELVSPWNPLRMILVVTGRSDEGVSKASLALNRTGHLAAMRGPVSIVQTVLSPRRSEGLRRDAQFTVADLGYEDEVVYGTRPHTLDYQFHMPLGWALVGEPQCRLYFDHAEIASPTDSVMDAYFNDVLIDSVHLDESNVRGGALVLSLPSWLIRPGRNVIHLSIKMNLDDEDTGLFLDAKDLWTAVYSRSFFHLSLVPQDMELSLGLFPYPFDKRPNLSGLHLVLPDRPQQMDYDAMLKLAAGLGAADRGSFLALSATTADLLTQEDRHDKDLIVIGRPSVHSLIAELNDILPQPFESGSDLLSPGPTSGTIVQEPARGIGIIEEIAAPWDSNRTILLLTGTTDEGVSLAGATLLSQIDRSDVLTGNLVLVDKVTGIHSFDTRARPSVQENQVMEPHTSETLLIQLGERWW